MSIWSTKVVMHVWEVDYEPSKKIAEIMLNTSDNSCLRLDTQEDDSLGGEASVMLDRAMAAKLAAKLLEFAETGDLTPERT